MRHLSVSPVPNLGKTLQSSQSDLTPWTLTLGDFHHYHQKDKMTNPGVPTKNNDEKRMGILLTFKIELVKV